MQKTRQHPADLSERCEGSAAHPRRPATRRTCGLSRWGGSPFAPGVVGHLSLELLVDKRRGLNVETGIDLDARRVRGAGLDEAFAVDEFTRYRLLTGLDDIGLSLTYAADITAFEARRLAQTPERGPAGRIVGPERRLRGDPTCLPALVPRRPGSCGA